MYKQTASYPIYHVTLICSGFKTNAEATEMIWWVTLSLVNLTIR